MTYSIVAADTATRQVGGAGTSCLGGQDVYIIYGGVPGYGVVHAQARANVQGRNRAAMLLADGQSPTDIVSAITEASFDGSAATRQYGIVDVSGNAAGFTGDATMPYADDRQGQSGSFAYSVQGNILTSAQVLDQAADAFEADGCDLAERLMRALEAGANGGEGDSRCTPDGIPSDSAFLQVELPDSEAGDYLSLRVESSGNDNPMPQLREQLDAWRTQHPCPVDVVPGMAGAAGMAGTPGSAGAAAAAGAPSAAGSGTGGGSGMSGSSGAAGNAGMAPGAPGAGASDDAGCSCHVVRGDPVSAGWLLFGFLFVVARRRRRRRMARQLLPIHAP